MWLKLFVGVIVFCLIAPILIVIPISFTSVSFFEFPPPGYSTKWYTAFSENKEWVNGVIRSLIVAGFTTLVATILGTMAAGAVARLEFRGKKVIMALIVSPMVIPVIIVGIALYHSFSSLNLTNSLVGLVFAHTVLAMPFVFVTVTASLKGLDRNLELAAMGLGSTPIGAFFKITMPLIRVGLLSGALFACITSLDELIVTIFLAGSKTKTLPIVMWENIRTQIDPTLAVVSTIVIACTVALFLIQSWITASSSRKSQDH